MENITIQIRLVDIILRLEKDKLNKLSSFINDFYYSFFALNKNYWEFEQWVKVRLGLTENKKVHTVSFFPVDDENQIYEFDEKFIDNYASLLEIFMMNNTFVDLYCHICNEKSKNLFIEFINYVIKNQSKKEQFIKCINKIKKLNFFNFVYIPSDNLEGIYTITDNIGYSEGFFSDGEKSWISKDRNIYAFDVRGANYIIGYHRGDNISTSTTIYLKNLEFDLGTLPDIKNLYSNRPLHPEIDFKQVDRKSDAAELIHLLNICYKQIEELSDSSDHLVRLFTNKDNNGSYYQVANKLHVLKKMLVELNELKLFLISECDKNKIINREELERILSKKYQNN